MRICIGLALCLIPTAAIAQQVQVQAYGSKSLCDSTGCDPPRQMYVIQIGRFEEDSARVVLGELIGPFAAQGTTWIHHSQNVWETIDYRLPSKEDMARAESEEVGIGEFLQALKISHWVDDTAVPFPLTCLAPEEIANIQGFFVNYQGGSIRLFLRQDSADDAEKMANTLRASTAPR